MRGNRAELSRAELTAMVVALARPPAAGK
jgi:hypothetical protein